MKKFLYITILFLLALTSCERSQYERYLTINANTLRGTEGDEGTDLGYQIVSYVNGAQQGFSMSRLGGINRRYTIPKSSDNEDLEDGYKVYFSYYDNSSIPNITISDFEYDDDKATCLRVNQDTILIEKVQNDGTLTISPAIAYKVVFNLDNSSEDTSNVDNLQFVLNPDKENEEEMFGYYSRGFSLTSSGIKSCSFKQDIRKNLRFKINCSTNYEVSEVLLKIGTTTQQLTAGGDGLYTIEASSTTTVGVKTYSAAERTVTIKTKVKSSST